MTDNEIVTFEDEMIQEATEAVAKGLDAGYTIESLLKTINRQKAEIEEKDIEIDILIKKKDAAYDKISELRAEVERLEEMLDIAVSSERNVADNIPYERAEAIKEFAEKLKEYFPSIAFAIDCTTKEMVGD